MGNTNAEIVTDYWTIDASGSWSTNADWYQVVPEPPPINSETLDVQPGIDNNADIAPSGSTPFSVTYDETDTVNQLSGSGIATLDLIGGTLVINQGGGWGGSFVNSGGTLDAVSGWSASGATSLSSGATDEVDSGTFSLGSGTLAGTVTGQGEFLLIGGDSFTLAPGFTINASVFDLAVNGDGFGSNTTFDTDVTYAGLFLLGNYNGNSANLFLNSNTLTLTGQADLNGYISGSGGLSLAGTTEITGLTINNATDVTVSGTVLQDGQLTAGTGTSPDDTLLAIAAGGTWDIIGDATINGYGATTISNQGLLEETGGTANGYVSGNIFNTGTLAVAGGQMVLTGAGTSTLAGTVTGAGSLLLQGSTFLIDPTVLDIPVLTDNAGDAVVEESLTYAGVLVDNNEIDLDAHTLTLSGQATLNSLISGPGTLVLADQATLSYATISAVVDVTGTVTDDGSTTYGPNAVGTISVGIVAGALYDQAGYTQYGFSSTDQIQVGIAAGATYDITGNTWTDNPNSNDNGVTTISNAGLLEKTASTGTSTIFTDLVSTGTVLVASGVLDLESITASTLDGSITGAGGLILGRNDIILDPSALNVPVLSLYANDVALGENISYAGAFTHGSGEISLGGYTLTLAGTAALNSYIDGPGTLILAGQASLSGFTGESAVAITGTVDQTGYAQFGATSTDTIQVTIASHAVYDLTANNWTNNPNSNDNGVATITNAGLLEATSGSGTSTLFTDLDNTGTVLVAAGGVLDLESITSSTLDGSIIGAGGLILGRDEIFLDPSTLTIPTLAFYAGDVALGENISYAGAFTHGSGEISLGGYTLTLAGTAALNSYIDGPGTLILAGQASLSGFTGESAVAITGTVDQTGYAQFGATSTDTIQVTIASHGVYDLTANNWTNNPNSNDNGVATITNAGLLEATSGSGTSTFYTDLDNTGTVLVAAGGVLDLESITSSTLDGSIIGAGGLILGRDEIFLDPSTLTIPTLAFYAGDVALGENISYAGAFTHGSGEISLGGYTLTLAGTAALNSYIDGPGTLILAGQASLSGFTGESAVAITGTVDQTGYAQFGATSTDTIQVTIASHGVYDLTANNWTNNPNSNDNGVATITNAGLLEATSGSGTSTFYTDLDNTGTVLVAAGGVLDLESITSSTLDGSIIGAGGLILGRDEIFLDPSTLTIPTLAFYAGDVALGENISYAGAFTHGSGEISLGGYTLTLAGTAALDNDFIDGPGTLILAGQASLSGFTGEAHLDIAGTVDQTGYVQFGTTSTDTIQVTIASHAIYDLTGNNATNNPNSNDNGIATITNAGLIEATSTTGTSDIYADIVNDGTILASGAVLNLAYAVTGSGAMILEAGSDLALNSSVSAGQTITFTGSAAVSLGDPGQFDGVIAGLTSADQIDLTSLNFANGGTTSLSRTDLLNVIDNGSTVSLQLLGNYSSQYFHLAAAPGGGIAVTENATPCYCRGTSILTVRGDVNVEHLEIGDHVITHAGIARPIRWIGRRSYSPNVAAGNRDILPIRIRAGALADSAPHRDLFVSPAHAMYIQGLLIPAWSLINGVSILQANAADGVTYYHIELDSHDVILAEGAASETFIDDDSRGGFDNASDYAPPAICPQHYCAPRVEDGELLEAVRRAIAARIAQPQMAELA